MKFIENEEGELSFSFSEKGRKSISGISALINSGEEPIAFLTKKGKWNDNIHMSFYENEVLSAVSTSEIFAKDTVLRQSVNFVANKPCLLTQAAVFIKDICPDDEGLSTRLGDGSILVHYCINRWQGEGQWRTSTPEDLGMYAATRHSWEKSWCRFQSLSSWSTATFFPIVIIEDKKRDEVWFFTVECGHSWVIELCAYGGRNDMHSLCVRLSGADEQLGFLKSMSVGESYRTCDCAYGVVKGGFEEAVQALVRYRRESSLVQGGCPLVFNDYMNCNWTNESESTLFPLIDKAAELGCELFCLDDGWQQAQGIWFPADEKFGEKGLAGVFEHIHKRGMEIGVWFEFETVPRSLPGLIGADDCFLFRNGNMVAPHRPIANFRSEKLVSYLNERVDAMYEMGVRFIKNDHNNAEGLGSTLYGESPAEGLEKNERAFLSFIDGIRERHPDLIIENCGSGAMRSEHGTLKHFHIQSTSDQEDYLCNPSIITGSLALIPPEKAGFWAYPYPLTFDDRLKSELSNEQIAHFKDGEETVFNLVSGFMGNMYVSGKIHQADTYNTKLLKEGITLYKKEREHIFKSVPIFPCGMVRLSERIPHAVGLLGENRDRLLLSVWNLSDVPSELNLDLNKYQMNKCAIAYPLNMEGVRYYYQYGKLCVKFSKSRQARLFILTKE